MGSAPGVPGARDGELARDGACVSGGVFGEELDGLVGLRVDVVEAVHGGDRVAALARGGEVVGSADWICASLHLCLEHCKRRTHGRARRWRTRRGPER